MKQSSFVLLFLFAFLLQSCIKDDVGMEGIDLSQTLPPYVELKDSNSDIEVEQGKPATVTFQMRTALQQKVTITYDVTGAINLPNQTLVLNRDALSGTVNLATTGTIIPPATSATAIVTLKSAVTENGTQLTLGSKNNPASQKLTINIVP